MARHPLVLPVLNRFLHWMVVGILSPVMVLMMQSKGASLTEVGFLMALLSAFVVVFELPSGVLSDRIGRKRIYLLSLTLLAASLVVLLFARGFGPLGLAFGLFGVARAFSSGSIEADFVDQALKTGGEERFRSLVLGMNVGETLGLAAGALAGGFLPGITTRLLPGADPYTGNIVFAFVLVVTLLGLTSVTHRSSLVPVHTPLGEFVRDAVGVLGQNRTLGLVLGGTLVWGFAFSALEVYWQPQLAGIAGPQGGAEIFGYLNGGYFLAAALGTLGANALVGWLRIGDGAAIGIFRIALGGGLVLLGLQDQVMGFGILYLVLMGFNGLVSVPEQTVLNLAIPDEKRSSLVSLASLAMQLGGIVASVAFSLVVAGLGIPLVWAMAGAVFALSSVLYFLLPRNTPKA